MPSAELALERFSVDTDASTLKRRSVHGAILSFGAQGFRIVLQLGSQIVMMHLLDPAAFGLIAMIMPVLSLVQIFNELGLTQATIQRSEITHADLSALFWISLGISMLLAAILALSAPLVALFYHEPRLVPVVICSASLLLLSGLSAQQIALMNRRMRFAALATIDVSCAVAAVIVGIASALAGFGYWSLVMMQAANSLTIAVLSWALSDWRPSLRPRTKGAGEMMKFGGHLTAFNVLGYAENNLGNILLGRFCGSVALGIYDRAFKLVIVPWWQISLPVARVAISLLSRLRGSDDMYIRAHHRMLQGLMLVALPGLIWASMTADRLVPMVLGHEWSAAVPVVSALALALTLMPFGSGAYWLYVSQGRVADQLRWGCVSAAMVIVSMVIGVFWGPVGIARSYAAFAVVIQGAPLWGATRRGPVTLAGVLRAAYPIIIGAVFSAIAIYAVQVALSRTGAGNIMIVIVTFFVSYGTCGACLLCFPDGLRIVRDVWGLRRTMQRVPALT